MLFWGAEVEFNVTICLSANLQLLIVCINLHKNDVNSHFLSYHLISTGEQVHEIPMLFLAFHQVKRKTINPEKRSSFVASRQWPFTVPEKGSHIQAPHLTTARGPKLPGQTGTEDKANRLGSGICSCMTAIKKRKFAKSSPNFPSERPPARGHRCGKKNDGGKKSSRGFSGCVSAFSRIDERTIKPRSPGFAICCRIRGD